MDSSAEQRIEKSDLLQNPGGDSSLWIHFHHRLSGSPSAFLCFYRRTKNSYPHVLSYFYMHIILVWFLFCL